MYTIFFTNSCMFLKQNICRLIAIRAKFISVLILVSTVRMLSGRQFEQLTIIILIARIQLILQLNRLRTAVEQLTRKNIIAQTVSSNNKIVSSRFFEQSQFEQMIMSLFVMSLLYYDPLKFHWRDIWFLSSRLYNQVCQKKYWPHFEFLFIRAENQPACYLPEYDKIILWPDHFGMKI